VERCLACEAEGVATEGEEVHGLAALSCEESELIDIER